MSDSNNNSTKPTIGKAMSNTMTNDSAQSKTIIVDDKPTSAFVNPGVVQTADKSKIAIYNMTETEAIFSASIEAKPLMMPEGLNIIVKKNEYSYRWVAFKARGGENLSKYKYMGFTKATLDDVDPNSEIAKNNPDGIILGDLLLMKIPKEIYYSHLKDNYKRANIARTKMLQLSSDTQKIKEVFPNGIPADGTGKPVGSFFKPGDAEVAASIKNQINLQI